MSLPLFDQPDEPEETGLPVFTVAEVSLLVKDALESKFSDLWVSGEVSNLRRPRSGHLYFDLKDEAAVISAVIWRSSAARLKFELRDGQQLLCHGGVNVYPPHGKYQLVVRHAEPAGEGALQVAFRQLHARLEKEGLFDPALKQPLPKFPRLIAVVTSPSGAAIRDFLQVTRRRWPAAQVLILPASVQGEKAAGEIAAAIRLANGLTPRPDVLVTTRGGGSLEDLWCFNEEVVVRAIHAAQIPVVNAVGHEIDITLSDLAADVRAPTPSAAAELIVPNREEIAVGLTATRSRLAALLQASLRQRREKLDALATRRELARPQEFLRVHAQRLDELSERMDRAVKRKTSQTNEKLSAIAAQLESLSPLGVLARGYSLTFTADGQLLTDETKVDSGDVVETQLANGRLRSRVE